MYYIESISFYTFFRLGYQNITILLRKLTSSGRKTQEKKRKMNLFR